MFVSCVFRVSHSVLHTFRCQYRFLGQYNNELLADFLSLLSLKRGANLLSFIRFLSSCIHYCPLGNFATSEWHPGGLVGSESL